jgi:hypothetical protein
MTILSDLKTVEVSHVVLCIAAFLATVVPGIAIIYHFRPDLLDKYDVIKLILLSVAFTLPVFLPNFFVVMAVVLCPIMLVAIFGLALSSTVLYLALLLSYFGSLNFFGFLLTIITLEILLLLSIIICVPWLRYVPRLGMELAKDQLKSWKEEAQKA